MINTIEVLGLIVIIIVGIESIIDTVAELIKILFTKVYKKVKKRRRNY